MRWSWELPPEGRAHLTGPLLAMMGRRQERAIWQGMKQYLEKNQVHAPRASA